MNLLSRQIKAVRETLEQVRGEYERKGYHSQKDCLLCKEFEHFYERHNKCSECPLTLLIDEPVACVGIAALEYNTISDVSLEDIAGFLESLLVSLKEMR